MRRLVTLLILAGAVYFAYDYFVVKGGENPFRLPEAKTRPTPDGELVREPGRGLNPFVTDTDSIGQPASRPPMPAIPGSSGSR